MIEARFSNDHSAHQLDDVMTILGRPRLWIPTAADYPRHGEWLDKTETEIADGTKRAMLGYNGSDPVGVIVYRRNETQDNVVDIRNISFDPSVRGRLFGTFALRQAEYDATQNDFEGVDTFVVDTKITNTGMISFLERQGYVLARIADLYQDGTGEDAILTKSLPIQNIQRQNW